MESARLLLAKYTLINAVTKLQDSYQKGQACQRNKCAPTNAIQWQEAEQVLSTNTSQPNDPIKEHSVEGVAERDSRLEKLLGM